MKRTRLIVTGRFNTETKSGKAFTIIEETRQTCFKPLAGAETWIDGTKSYRTDTHRPVNWVSDTEFEIVETGEIAIRV